MARPFADRNAAGRQLAAELDRYAASDAVVLALPRGGVPVAAPVAEHLGAELDVIVVRKIGVPGHPELAMGAVAAGATVVRNHDVITGLGISDEVFQTARDLALAELAEKERLFRGTRAPVDVTGRLVLIVDDGIATGSTMMASIDVLRERSADRIVVAVPVAPPDVASQVGQVADEVVALLTPRSLGAVGLWYRRFGQTSDSEVRRLLGEARGR